SGLSRWHKYRAYPRTLATSSRPTPPTASRNLQACSHVLTLEYITKTCQWGFLGVPSGFVSLSCSGLIKHSTWASFSRSRQSGGALSGYTKKAKLRVRSCPLLPLTSAFTSAFPCFFALIVVYCYHNLK